MVTKRRIASSLVALAVGCSAAGAPEPPATSRWPDVTLAAGRPQSAPPAVALSQADAARVPVGGSAPDTRVPAEVPSAAPAGAATKPRDPRPRMAAIDQFAYIYKRPAANGLALGYVRMGTSVPLLSDKPVAGEDCSRGWYAVAPRGYVCLNRRTTLDLEDPYFKVLSTVAPEPGALWPYRYAFSNGAPMYSRVPTKEEWEKQEKRFGPAGSFVQLAEWSAGHEELIVKDPIEATDAVPAFLADGKRTVGGGTRDPRVLLWRVIPNGSMLAYARAFEQNGRVWLLTADLMVVPADRVRKLRPSTFHGIDLGQGVDLPLAWNRTKKPKPKYRKANDGSMVEITDALPPKSSVAVTDERIVMGKDAYLPVKDEPEVFVLESDVTVARARTTLPNGVDPGEKWIEAKILPGTLTAYEGTKPVRSTLFSPGKGGVPIPGHDMTKDATTQIGFFPLEWKDRTATMSNEKSEPKVLWFSDVPHIQYLKAPLAMHVSYWHEDFGNPKSAECVNVAPMDGRWLFDWTLPVVPEGWGGIRPGDGAGPSTPVVVTAR